MSASTSLGATALFLSIVMAAADPAAAVNLVPNQSFEGYTPCPSGLSEIANAAPWDTPNQASPDLYNVCATAGSGVSVPSNTFGSQAALTGVGYAGIIVRPINDYREYLEVPLATALTASVSYTVSFNLSLCDLSNITCDRIGAYLSVGSVGPVPGVGTLPFTPQIESAPGNFLTDKTNWITVSGTYMAAGGENSIVIGNFHDNATTNLTSLSGSYNGVYFYVDDVLVEANTVTDEACCLPDGSCGLMLPGECQSLGGSPQGPGSTCGPDACHPVAVAPSTWSGIKARTE
ncbi:MAG TPA: hypothetical protein VF720_07015 [Candidatus Eisenbacteria bacterium]